MIELFDLEALVSGSQDGEMHLHESEYSCSSIFAFPNKQGLKGIAPHKHTCCDDIEIVLRGEVIAPTARNAGVVLTAPFLIINPANHPHGFVATTGPVMVLGVRCPRDYKGESLLDKWSQLGNAHGPIRLGRFVELRSRRNAQYFTTHCVVNIHQCSAGAITSLSNCNELILVSIGPDAIDVSVNSLDASIPSGVMAVVRGRDIATISSRGYSTVIAILPLKHRGS